MNPEEKAHYEAMIQSEIDKRLATEEGPHPLRAELFSVGGGLAGASAGIGSINALETMSEQRALKHAEKLDMERRALRMLKDIHDGRKTWNDVAAEARPTLQEMFKENLELLSDNSKYEAMMNNLGPSNLVRIHPERQQSRMDILKKALPNGALFNDFRKTLKHPAVSAGALAGMTGGYYLSKMTEK